MASAIMVVMPPPHMGQGEWARNLREKVGRESLLDGGTRYPVMSYFNIKACNLKTKYLAMKSS